MRVGPERTSLTFSVVKEKKIGIQDFFLIFFNIARPGDILVKRDRRRRSPVTIHSHMANKKVINACKSLQNCYIKPL